MTFNDIFKSSFLENVSEFSILDTLIGLAVAQVIGLFIFIIYKKTLTGVLYSSGFALTLVGLSLVTTLVIMAVTSNVVLSLGMVGALSIVRFRTAIKEPVEIVFLFWSLAVGIVIGAGDPAGGHRLCYHRRRHGGRRLPLPVHSRVFQSNRGSGRGDRHHHGV